MTIPVSPIDLPAPLDSPRCNQMNISGGASAPRGRASVGACTWILRTWISGSLCVCFCVRDGAIPTTPPAGPVITRSACGGAPASERPAHFNNCYYYRLSMADRERWTVAPRAGHGGMEGSRCVPEQVIVAEISAGEAELGPPGRERAALGVIRGPNPNLTTQQTAASQPCRTNREANQRGSIETRSRATV